MRKPLLLLSLLTLLAGCAHRPVADVFPSSTVDPVAVRLLPPEGGFLRFLTSEPGHVAIFEIAPDRGVSMLYPQFREESDRVSRAGVNVEFLPWRPQGRWFYASTAFYPSFAARTRPTYLYIIASRSPLRIEDIRLQPSRLRSSLGWHSFLASDLSGTLDDLESLVVGDIANEDWSSDLYVIWPEVPLDQPWQTRYVFINCPDGRTAVLPLGWNINACPGTSNLAQATKPATPPANPDSPPGLPETDSTGIPVKPRSEPTDTKPHRPDVPRAIGAIPKDAMGAPRIHEAPRSLPVPDRGASAPPPIRVDVPRPAPEPRSAPASMPAAPRVEPQPRPADPVEPRAPTDPKQPNTF